MKKTVKFYTLGCKVNQYDTQDIRERFLDLGFEEPGNGRGADVYVVNTCTVTHRADSDSLNIVRKAIRENPRARVIVTGCLTELDSARIKSIKGVSLIVRNKDKARIAVMVDPAARHPARNKKGISLFFGHSRAFLKVQDGCNNFCAYCKVPLVRGRSRSRPQNEIVAEAGRLVKNGFREIVLSGICLGAFGRDLKPPFKLVDLIAELEKIEELRRIRLSSIEPGDVNDKLLHSMLTSKKLCRHLHIPLQSGDDRVLRAMRRPYGANDYAGLIKKINRLIPQIALTTDVLVGFPGESAENFQNTVRLVREICPLKVHIFPYSPRAGTLASGETAGLVAQAAIRERISCLKLIAQECAFSYKKQFLGQVVEVFIEGRKGPGGGFWEGYTDTYIKVWVKARRNLENQLIKAKIREIGEDHCLAEPVF